MTSDPVVARLVRPRSITALFLAAVWASYAGTGESDSLPCGVGAKTSLPPGASISIDVDGVSTMSIKGVAGTVHLRFPGVMDAVEQVCDVPGGRLLVFGKSGRGVYNIEIINRQEWTLQDSLYGYTPLLSPNQRWIIWRKFYPVQAADASEEYLLYDMTKGAEANRAAGIRLDDMDSVGRVAYPVVKDGRPFENGAYPPDQRHVFQSQSFYWAADSSAVVFADREGDRGPLTLVLVTVSNAVAATHIRPVPAGDVCSSSGPQTTPNSLTLIGASVSRVSRSREVEASFSASGVPCGPRTLLVPESEFHPAPIVVPAKASRKPAVPE